MRVLSLTICSWFPCIIHMWLWWIHAHIQYVWLQCTNTSELFLMAWKLLFACNERAAHTVGDSRQIMWLDHNKVFITGWLCWAAQISLFSSASLVFLTDEKWPDFVQHWLEGMSLNKWMLLSSRTVELVTESTRPLCLSHWRNAHVLS